MHTLLLKGPFTHEDIARIIMLVQDIESRQPDQRFDVVTDDPETGERIGAVMAEANLQPGYERITITKLRG